MLIGGGLVEEKMIEEVVDVCDEDGRYSKAGLCGDLEDNEELEYCRSVSSNQLQLQKMIYHFHLLT